MTNTPLTEDQLAALRAFDTPSICNAIEIGYPERRGFGFTSRTLHCARPDLPPMVGYARTVRVRARRAADASAEALREIRFGYLDYLESGPMPSVSVVEDLDGVDAGFGAFWGEVNTNIHKALGCLGTVTNGSVRDLDMLAEGFQALSSVVAPSHGHIHAVDFGGEVAVAGMIVRSGDLIHADRHGAVVIPHDIATRVAGFAEGIGRREAVILDACRGGDASAAAIKQAMIDSAKVPID